MRVVFALAFPALIWYLGSFYFHGDLGKWLDDYAAHVRDPVTGSFEWSKLLRYPWWFFWRPIHVQLVFVLQTLLWNHDWVNHLFSALMHALACFNLWRFLRVAGIGRPASAIAALLLLAAPQANEVIVWPATVSTSIAVAAFFWAARIAIRHAQERHRGPAVLVLAVLGAVIPCLYEQPAAALAALPILYIAAARTRRPPPALLATLKRTVVALAPCGLGVLLYLALFLATVTRDGMARESQFIPADQLLPRVKFLPRNLLAMLDPVAGFEPLWQAGLEGLRSSSLGLSGWIATTALGAVAWLAWIIRSRRAEVEGHASAGAHARVARWGLMLFSLGALALAIIPIFAIRGASFSPRLTYFPVACVLVAAAAVLDALLTLTHRRGAALIVAGAAIGAFCGSIVLIGAQSYSRLRYQTDMAVLRELPRLVPDPPPDTIFVPVSAPRDPRFPHTERLSNSYLPVWTSPWAMTTAVKHAFGRSDVSAACMYQHNQATSFVRIGEPSMIAWSHYVWKLPTPRLENYCPRFGLDRIVPFTIGPEGQVTLVDRITSRLPDGSAREFVFPIVRAAAARSGRPARSFDLAVPIETGHEWVVGWTWPNKDNREVRFLRLESWGAADRAVKLHPPTDGNKHFDACTDAMDLALEPSEGRRSILFHATFEQATIDLSVLGDGVELVWTLADSEGRATELHRLRMDPKRTKSAGSWSGATVEIPAIAGPATLRLTVLPGPSRNPSYDRVVVTCGEWLTPAPASPSSPQPERKK